jgi:hypothetical protein
MASSTIPAGGGGGLAPKYQKFTSSGTFTLPDGYGATKPLLVNIQVIGGGGGGANAFYAGARFGVFSTNNGYYGNGAQAKSFTNATVNSSGLQGNAIATGCGGSGGIAATQFYLTANLTITVGASGAIGSTITSGDLIDQNVNSNGQNSPQNYTGTFGFPISGGTGGTGGTTTAGSVSASGGTGGTVTRINGSGSFTINGGNGSTSVRNDATGFTITSIASGSAGTGGTPSGTAGGATPLLGTLAGGSGTSSPVFGSFGVGGKYGDVSVPTGVEGTGGGIYSLGAPGAVILTWWQ